MDSYSFTYKDVLKRYERIINKPSKFEIRLLATILLIITIVNISSLCFASETESVETSVIPNLYINPNANYFQSAETGVGYFQLEKGYVYHISNNSGGTTPRMLAVSENIPALNGSYQFLGGISDGETYDYLVSSDNQYLYFDYSITYGISVTREKLTTYEGAVSDLVDNVGISQIWDVFDSGIGFVGVVVLAAFGIFLVVIAIRKMQKGKSEF